MENDVKNGLDRPENKFGCVRDAGRETSNVATLL